MIQILFKAKRSKYSFIFLAVAQEIEILVNSTLQKFHGYENSSHRAIRIMQFPMGERNSLQICCHGIEILSICFKSYDLYFLKKVRHSSRIVL